MLQSPRNLLTSYAPRPPVSESDSGTSGWFDLDDWVGPRHPSKRPDIAKLEGILANSGDYSLERTQGPTGYWGLALDDGIRKYQKRNGLKIDGTLRPGGPTIEHMRENFAVLLDGHTPPTPDDIDAHHDIVGDNNPGTIAWQDPPATFANVANLPEVDQETDASNARLARGMAKSGDFRSYAQLFARTIQDSGLSGIAAVNDVIQKFDAINPGKGGLLASAVQNEVPEETLKAFGLARPEAPPKGVVQMAGKFDAPMKMLGNLLRRVPPLLMPQPNDTGKLPGRTPADNENTQTPPSGSTTPNLPTHSGGSIETPKVSDSIETFPADSGLTPEQTTLPPLNTGERQRIVGKFLDEFSVVYSTGNYIDNRGLPKTVKLNNVTAKACQKAIGESDFPELIKQLGGASEEGKKQKYMKEKTVKTPGKDRLPDYLMGTTDENDKIEHGVAINTVTVRADGSPIPREQAQIDDLIRSNVIRFVDWLAKAGDGEDPKDSFDAAYRKCKEGVKILEENIRADIASGKRAGKR